MKMTTSTKIPRILIAGLSGGSGKSMLCLGLARALARRGLAVRPFKKGPDYIDAAWLGLAAGRPARNLDPFMADADLLPGLFIHGVGQGGCADIALIEGNRGLFDGRDLAGSCSSAELARRLKAPVILTLDCTKMTRTAAALVSGCKHFEPGLHLGGAILNRATRARHRAILKQAVEELAATKVFGLLPRLKEPPIAERHMGLAFDGQGREAQSILDSLADLVEVNCDIQAILALAAEAPPLEADGLPEYLRPQKSRAHQPRIGYVKDAAFWFYYQENLEALRLAGADLIELSLLDPAPWPENLAGLYLGGGFPELYAGALAANPQRRASVRNFVEAGRPVYAECGGLMYLARSLRVDGRDYPMAGVFPLDLEFCPSPQGLGYVEAGVKAANPFHPLNSTLRGHEFHYSRPLAAPPGTVLRLKEGCGLGNNQDGLAHKNCLASYTHIYAPGAPHWARNFVKACY